jgi:adenosylhomocysteine nucleosidase
MENEKPSNQMKKPKHILVLAAMKEEELSISRLLQAQHIQTHYFGKKLVVEANRYHINDTEVLVAQSGMGGVNAALTIHSIAEEHPIDAVILLGVGGSIVPGLQIGDLVLSSAVVQHDYYSSLDCGHHRMKPGDLILSKDQVEGYDFSYPANRDLMDMLLGSLNRESISHAIHVGVVMSGGEFVGTHDRKKAIQLLHPDAKLVDMEAAGVAQICARLNLPFVVMKTVADRLSPEGKIESDFIACLNAAADNAAAILHAFLKKH